MNIFSPLFEGLLILFMLVITLVLTDNIFLIFLSAITGIIYLIVKDED